MRLNSFLQFFTRGWRKTKTIGKRPAGSRRTRLAVEMLERRDLLAVPTIISTGVLPIDGSTTATSTPAIRVQFSETMSNSALVSANYILLSASGTSVPIDSVVFDNSAIGGAPVNSVVDLNYNGGNPLLVDNYTLFAEGDKLIDADDGYAMTQPGQLVVANGGRNSVSVVSMPGDGTLGAVSNYGVPGTAVQAANPTAIAMGDLNGDGLNDLAIVNQGTNQLTVFLGEPGGGYPTVPDLTMAIPATPTSVIISDLNKDGQPEIIVGYSGASNGVMVFLNTSTPGSFSTDFGTTVALDNAASQPASLAAGDFDGDGNMDVAVAISNAATDLNADGQNDSRVDILTGDGTAALTFKSAIRVGDVVPAGLQTPAAIAVGTLNLDSTPDIVVGGANGIVLLQNTSTIGNPAFFVTPTFLTASNIVDVNTLTVGSGGLLDVVGTTPTGTVEVYRNVSTTAVNGGSFLPAQVFNVAGGTSASSRLAVGDMNGDGKSDLAITSGTAVAAGPGKLTVLKDTTIGGSITAASDPGLIVITSAHNGLKTGQSVAITGAIGNTAANNPPATPWTITQLTGNIITADGSGSTDIVINCPAHGLTDGESVTITGNSFASANGVFNVTVIDADDFSLDGTAAFSGSGAGGTWTSNDRFSLDGSTANGNYIGGGIWALVGNIVAVDGPGGLLPVTITSPNSGLVTGDAVTINGSAIAAINGNTYTITAVLSGTETSLGAIGQDIAITAGANHNLSTGDTVTITGDTFPAANGTFVITVTSPTTFTLNGTAATDTNSAGTGGAWTCNTAGFTLNGTAGIVGSGAGGTWTTAVNFYAVAGSPYNTDTTPMGVVIGETNGVGTPSTNQYASSVFAFSSQYTTTSWAASQALGPPNVFSYGDDPSAWSALNPDGPPNPEFLDLRYSTPVNATGVVIRETYNSGFVTRIDLVDTSDVYHTVFNGVDPSALGSIANFTVTFAATPYLVKGVKIYINPNHVAFDWEEIDSVQLLSSAATAATAPGIPDVVTVNSAGNDFSRFLGQGDGTLQTGVNTSLTPLVTDGVVIADLNLDGIPDLVMINNNNNSGQTQVTVMPGIGGGNYGTPINFAVGAGLRSLNSLAVGDVNGDGMPDIAFTDSQDNNVGFLINTLVPKASIAAGALVPKAFAPPVTVGRTPTQLVLADFNGDGKLDLVVSHNGGGFGGNRRGVTFALGNGDGTFQGTTEYDNNHGMTGIVVGDFNKDGHLDFAAVETPGGFGSANVWINNGDGAGNFSAGTSFSTGLTSPGAIQAADFNGDGYLDVVVASTSNSFASGGLAVLLNQLGTGFGAPLQTNYLAGQGITSLITADINRDGLADVIVAANPIAGGISGATNAGPIVITSNNHGLVTGQQVFISGVGGDTAANGQWTITVVDNNHFSLNGSTGNGGYTAGGKWYLLKDNVYVLTGLGDGTFKKPVPYLAGDQGGPPETPSYLAATSSGLVRVTTFTSGGKTVISDLINNGDFESRDLTGEHGNILGWQTFDFNTSPGGSQGKWLIQSGFASPLSNTNVSPPSGSYSAMLDQANQIPYDPAFYGPNPNPNPASSFSGSHALYQDFTIPANVASATLSLSLSIDNTYSGVFTDPSANSSLDFNTAAANQQVRVDIMRATAPILSVSTKAYATGLIATATGTGSDPIVIATVAANGLATGNLVILSGVAGFASANGTYTITVIDATHFSLNGTTAAGSGVNGTWNVAGDVLRNEFQSGPTTPVIFNGAVTDLDLTAFAGQTVRLRIASANNQGLLIVGVDNVTLKVEYDDTVAPTLTGLNVSNPAFVSASANVVGSIVSAAGAAGNPIVITTAAANTLATGNFAVISGNSFAPANGTFTITVIDSTHFSLNGTSTVGSGIGGTWKLGIPHTDDPTLIGNISDNSGLAGISYIEFNPNNNGFGLPGDFKITTWDSQGNFRFTLPNPAPGLDTIGVQVVDRAGNATQTTFTFFMQSNSVTEWEAVGPQGIDVTGQGVDYTTVSGRITVTVPDVSDPLGNSYFVGSANGGVWKTTDGGSHWVALTNSVSDGSGNPVPVPIGGLAQSLSNPNILYAATGVGDDELDSRPGIGVLKSIDGGRTWTVIGNSGTVLAGARAVKVVIDANNSNIAYVAIASGGTSGPGVYKTTDGGKTWNNVLNPANMTYLTVPTNPGSSTVLGAGHALDSVTDMIIDPADSNRLIIGLGSISLSPAAGTGVWAGANQGGSWHLVEGGDSPFIPLNGLPNELVAGTQLGRVTVAIGSGRTGNEGYVYVLIGTPPGNNTPPNVDWGTFSGLYRTKDNMLNFTKVMLKQDLGPTGVANVFHNFQNINLLGRDASNAGIFLVDPNDPNVVYVGGSTQWSNSILDHSFIRVDTGNMSDTTAGLGNNGDDAFKFEEAAFQGNLYDPSPGPAVDKYFGEGVYWYDLSQNASNTTGPLTSLPPSITSLSVDSQGRLLVGTIGGIWRGVGLGFGYDYTSGGTGIFGGFGGGGGGFGFNVPAMTFTSINGNLQIADMTSVAVDPFNRGVYYTTQIGTGVAGSTAPLDWVSQGLTGPTVDPFGNLGIPSAGSVLTANPAPNFLGLITSTTGIGVSPIVITTASNIINQGLVTGATVVVGGVQGNTAANGTFKITVIDATHFSLNGITGNGDYISGGNYGTPAAAGTPVSLYRIWQYASLLALRPETSSDNGANWSSINSSGISINTPAGFFPAFAIDPTPILQSGQYQTALGFGANVVYTTDTSATVWDQISGVLSPGADVSALAFAPSDPTAQTMYAATTDGRVFYTGNKGGDSFPERDAGLPTGIAGTYVQGITVDPINPNEVFVMYGGTGTNNHVWRSLDAGVTWTDISATLPHVPTYAMVIDRQPGLGAPAPNGKLYLATEVGVFYSIDNGATWARLGQGMPNVPVVDLKYDAGLKILAAATLGRGVYTINTSPFSFIADQTVNENTPSSAIPFTVNNPNSSSFTLSAVSDNQFLIPNSKIVITPGRTGTNSNQTIQFTPALNANTPKDGVANITVTVSSGGFSYQQSFQVTVNFVNQVPTISPIGNQVIFVNQVDGPINFAVNDVETAPGALVVTATVATVSNPALLPAGSLVVGGTGPNRTLTITPASNMTGTAVIAMSVTDGNGATTTETFNVLVTGTAILPFNDDFNRSDNSVFLGPYWNVNTGSFAVSANQAKINAGLGIASLNQLSVADVAVQADVSVGLNQNVGLIARYNGGVNNMYVGMLINTGGAFQAVIYKNVGGIWTKLAGAPVNFGVGTLRFEVAADSLKLFYGPVAGTLSLVAFANDRSLTAPGTVGLRSTTGNLSVDNFAATAISLTTPPMPFSDSFTQADGQLSTKWIDHAGNFAIASDILVANPGAPFSLATLAGLNQTNGLAQADVDITNNAFNSQAGVVVRYSTNGYYYGQILKIAAGYTASIFRVTATGTFVRVGAGPINVNLVAGGTGTVRLEVVGSSLKLFYGPDANNLSLITYGYDTSLASGASGVRALANLTIDNFSADAITLKAPIGMPFTDDFSTAVNGNQLYGNAGQLIGPDQRNWQDQAGDFIIAGGVLMGNDANVSFATLYDNVAADLTNQAAQADLVVDPAVNQQAGVVVRFGATGYYYADILSTATGFKANILKFTTGVGFTNITQNPANAAAPIGTSVVVGSGSGTVRLEADGPTLKLFYNGTLVAFATDSSFASGLTGVRASKGATTTIANFEADAVALTSPGLPFSDDFSVASNGNQLSYNWTERQGNFTVDTGSQQLTGNATLNLATVNGIPPLADESVQVSIASGVANQGVGLVARYQANGSYYLATITGNAAQTVYTPHLFKFTPSAGFVAITATTLTPASPITGTGTMKFEVVGNSLKLFWDGALVMDGFDGAITAPGLMGIRSTRGVALSGFSADQITLVTPPTLPFSDNFTTPVNGNQLYGDPAILTDPDQRNWDERSGNIVINGASQIVGNDSTVSIATVHGVSLGNAAVQADFDLTAAGQHAGLILRYQPNGSFYVALLVANPGDTTATARIFKSVGGVFTQLGSTVTVNAVAGTLRFEAIGADLKMFFGAGTPSLVTYVYDASLPATGLTGVRLSLGAAMANFSTDAITLINPAPTPPAALPFTDDFLTPANGNQLNGNPATLSSADQRNWQEVAGNFTLDGSGIAAGASAASNIATVFGLSLANPSVQANVDNLLAGQNVGLVARYQANGSYYVGLVSASMPGASTIYTPLILKYVGGSFVQINATPIGAVGASGTLRFDVTGTSLKLYWNNTLVTYGFDGAISAAGLAGVRAYKNGAFDTFSIDQIAVVNPTIPPAFNDSFADPDDPANTPLSLSWTERAGLFNFTGTALQAVAPTIASIATVNTLLTNSITQEAITIPVSGTHTFGLVARFDPATGNTYIGKLTFSGASVTASIYKRVGGSMTLLSSAPVSVLGSTGVLQLNVVASSIKLFFGPTAGALTLAAYANDSAISAAGYSGVYVGPTDTVSAFSLNILVPTTPALTFNDPLTGADGTQLSTNWLERAGNYGLVSNSLVGKASANIATVNGLSVANPLVRADVVVGVGQYAGVIARYQANGSFYTAVVVTNNAGSIASLFRYDAGVGYTLLASAPVGSGSGTLSLEVVGNNLKLFYGANAGSQTLVAYAYDVKYTTGTTGIRSSSGATFNNFSTAAVAVATSQPGTPFTKTFPDSPPTQQIDPVDWHETAGNFNLTGGGAIGQAALDIAVLNGYTSANVDVSAQVAVSEYAGLVARYSGAPGKDTYYAAAIQFIGVNNYVVEIDKVINGVKTVIGSVGVASFINTIDFLVVNGNLNVYLDGNALATLTVADSSITAAGAVGIRTSAGTKVNKFTVN